MKNLSFTQIIVVFLGACLAFLSYFAFFYPYVLDVANFLHWDAEHYNWIRTYGYKDFRVAFFPLFPMLWKYSCLSVYGIVLLNITLFYAAFYWLMKSLNSTALHTLLYLSLPCFCFFYLPYTEATFFVCTTLLLFGLKHNNLKMSLLGLLLCTLTRPAFTVFIPALCIAEYFTSTLDKRLFQRLALYLVTALVAVGVVGLIQYSYTGAWFECFKAQKLWGNELQLPKFPLTSWAGGLIVRLDAAAFCIGLIAASFLTSYIFNLKKLQELSAPKEVLFAIAYLAGISILVLFLRGGVLAGMSRYVISTPCIIIALDYYLKQNITFSKRTLGFIFVGFLLFFLCFFGAYVHIQVLLKFALLSAYLCLVFGIKSASAKGQITAFIALIVINIFFQAFFWIRFLENGWVS